MKDKYLITVVVPKVELEFNVYVPSNKKMGTIKKYILSSINSLSGNSFNEKDSNAFFIDKDTGSSFDSDVYVRDSGIKNGSKIIVI